MKLEDQIRALLEAKNTDKEDDQADRVEDEPAVKIENPMDPDLKSSEGETETPEGEIAAADAQGQEADGETKEVKEEAAETEESCEDKVEEAVAESISDLLGDEFSAEFKLQAQTIFEAAVKDQVLKIQEKLQEEHKAAVDSLEAQFVEKLATESARLQEETSDKIDGYLSYLAEEWRKDNEVALEQAIKTELTESFIGAMKSVFESHYIELPEDKVDLYQQVTEQKAELETALATTVSSLAKLTEEVNAFKRDQIIEESIKDFSSLDASRFKALTEEFVFEDTETFKARVDIVKKSFFGKKTGSAAKEQLVEELTTTTPIVEDASATVETIVEDTSPMSAYVRALGKK